MLVRQAKERARQWMYREAGTIPAFAGAFFHGSTNWLPDDAILPSASDLDVMIVLDTDAPPVKRGKFVYRDVLLEVSYLPVTDVRTAEQVLSRYELAGSFHTPSVILDPSGHLTALNAMVAREYRRHAWVSRRCADARSKVLRNLSSLDPVAPFHDQVIPWLFGTGVTTHVLLVAGLKNPTVRTRYGAVRDLLAEYGQSAFYPALLELLGCAHMRPMQVERHLDAVTAAFDAAQTVITTPFPFTADISDAGRPVAIDGSRELIARGDHREAVFWIVATYSRCMQVFHRDGPPAMQEQFGPGYRRLLGDLGIETVADLHRRAKETTAFLPQVWDMAETIVAANPDIEA